MPTKLRYADVGNARWVEYGSGLTYSWGGSTVDRENLVYGQYIPDASTTGLVTPESELEDWNNPAADTVSINAGAVIVNKIVYGDMTCLGDAEFRNCLLVGGNNTLTSGNKGILTRNSSGAITGIVKFYDCRFRVRKESDRRDCVIGRQFELYRCHLSGGVDCIGIYASTAAPTAGAFVKVKGCLLEDMAYTYPAASQDDGTHNDGIQIQGGHTIEIVGNAIWGTAHKMVGSGTFDHAAQQAAGVGFATEWMFTDTQRWMLDYPEYEDLGWNPGAGIIIQDNISAGVYTSNTIITDNYIFGCKHPLLIKSTAGGSGWVCKRNWFSKDFGPAANSAPPPTNNPVWIRFDDISDNPNIDGLTSGGVLNSSTNLTNKWLDGATVGQVLVTPRASGVLDDTP
jgi:hypothetical protein